jgi:hypothetical protein
LVVVVTDDAEAQARAAYEDCWRSGNLRFLLHADQQRVYDELKASKAERYVLEIARKWGKTWLLCVLAMESCLEEPGSRCVYGGPSLKHLEEFIQPIMRELSDLAPPDCRPVWKESDSHWVFPERKGKRSWIHLFSADDLPKARRGRGPKARRALFDEAGFTPVLEYVLNDVFRPSLMLNTDSRRLTVLGSTPSDIPDHQFTLIAEIEERDGNYAHRTIHDNPMMTREQIAAYIAENARQSELTVEQYVTTETFRREYLAERVINRLLVAVPEWAAFREESFALFRSAARPKLYRGHVSVDFGGSDPHAALFGYFDLKRGVVVERDMLIFGNETSRELDDEVKRIEGELWGVTKWDGTLAALTSQNVSAMWGGKVPDWLQREIDKTAQPQPYLRVCDTQMKLARHLHKVGIACLPTEKDEKRFYVQELRNLILAKQLVVNPECKDFDRHLKTTTWKDLKHAEWSRRGTNGREEHGDLVDCAVYLNRNMSRSVPVEAAPVSRTIVASEGRPKTRLEARLERSVTRH